VHDFFAAAAVLLMVLDGFLTELGFKWYKRYASRFVGFESFELNPAWAKDAVSSGLALNPWRLAAIGFVAVALFFSGRDWLVGLVFFPNLFIFIRHLNGLFSWRNYAENARGRIWLKKAFGVRNAVFSQFIEGLVPLACYLFVPEGFFLGGFAGCLILGAYLYLANSLKRGRTGGRRG